MKILILGHKGMLGSDLFGRFCLDNEVTGRDVGDFDLTSEDSCRQVIEEATPQVILNAAAFTDVDGAEAKRDLCYAVNAQGLKNLVNSCDSRRIKIVHFSTDYVFDGMKGSPYDEEDTPNPLNAYGESKAAGEQFLMNHGGGYILIRTSWLFGMNGKNFVRTILDKAKTEKRLTVVDDQIGSPTYTKDLAGAVQILLEGEHTGVFHVTNRGYCSWYDFAVRILKCAGMEDVTVEPIQTDVMARPARRPLFSVLSNRKFRETTGRTTRTWQLALDDFIDRLGQPYR